MNYLFRIDDVSLNTNVSKLTSMIGLLRAVVPKHVIMLAVCPAVSELSLCESELVRERPYPSMMKIESDFAAFYRMERIGMPPVVETLRQDNDITVAAHGMTHADHRLMSKGAQELSIVMSCALVNSFIFVPPFHHWNSKTEKVCAKHHIELVKYDASWTHLAYHNFDPHKEKYYFHTHDFTYKDFRSRFP